MSATAPNWPPDLSITATPSPFRLNSTVFPSWFVGVAFAAIAIGALVPSAVMSVACANIVSRNIYREFVHAAATDAQEAQVAKVTSLVKAGALAFVISCRCPTPCSSSFWAVCG